jgi:hypothetical protein
MFLAIGALQKNLPSGVPLIAREWSEDREIEHLLECDVGIMPLPDIRWTQGKCGFKIIQYFACGIPAVASPIGVNKELIINGENGFLAGSLEEWLNALIILHDSPDLRARMGAQGRLLIENQYSLQSMTETYKQFITSCMPKRAGL